MSANRNLRHVRTKRALHAEQAANPKYRKRNRADHQSAVTTVAEPTDAAEALPAGAPSTGRLCACECGQPVASGHNGQRYVNGAHRIAHRDRTHPKRPPMVEGRHANSATRRAA